MPKSLRYFFIGLFSYRASRLLTKEDGPLDAFYQLRDLMGVNNTVADTRPQWAGSQRPATQLGRIFDCPYCMGCYLTPISYALFAEPHPVRDKVLIAGALTGIQSALQSLDMS